MQALSQLSYSPVSAWRRLYVTVTWLSRYTKAFDKFDEVLGVMALRRIEDEHPPVDLVEIEQLVDERNTARRNRDFSLSDRIRDDLDARGVILEDTSTGTRWKRK